jgi:hypothetical protein
MGYATQDSQKHPISNSPVSITELIQQESWQMLGFLCQLNLQEICELTSQRLRYRTDSCFNP